MGFRSANITAHMIKFNSAVSADFLDFYNNLVNDEIIEADADPKHRSFAPSQMRCDRVSWFRLRGTQPDKIVNPDARLKFTADIGTACHEMIQARLSNALGLDWISVNDWIRQNPDYFANAEMEVSQAGYESRIDMKKPYPVRFGCDGIFKFEGKVRLLEIKTAESSSLVDLVEPKPKHLDQIKCYATLLHIPDVVFLYMDRNYGETKCFEVTVNEFEQQKVRDKMDRVLELVEANIAPEGLPVGDPDCTQNMCPYYKVCRQWGR